MNKKKAFVGVGLGVILLTSVVSLMGQGSAPDNSKIKDIDSKIGNIETKRERMLDMVDNASIAWQQDALDDESFREVIDQSIVETDALRAEYLSLNLASKYDKYKQLSIESLDKQKEALLKLKEYSQTEDPDLQQLIRVEFDQLLITSFEYHRDARTELT